MRSRRTIVVPGKHVGEGKDVPHLGPAEAVDGLVVVPDDAEVRLGPPQLLQELELGDVGVLVLVHEDHPEPLARSLAHLGVRAHEADGEKDQVPEVDVARLSQRRLVAAIALADRIPPGDLLRRGIRHRGRSP